jgi:hypothetical protein
MIDERFIEVMHAEIDGKASDAELSELRKYLQENGEAREYYESLQNVSRQLSKVEMLEAPSDIKASVMRRLKSIRRENVKGISVFSAALDSIRSLFSARSGLSYAVGLATGLILMAVIFYPESVSHIDRSGSTGALILDGPGDTYELVDQRQFKQDGVAGVLESRAADGVVVVTLRVTSKEEVSLNIAYDRDDLHFQGSGHDYGTPFLMEVGSDQVSITHRGTNAYILVFTDLTPEASDLTLRVIRGQSHFSETIKTKVS